MKAIHFSLLSAALAYTVTVETTLRTVTIVTTDSPVEATVTVTDNSLKTAGAGAIKPQVTDEYGYNIPSNNKAVANIENTPDAGHDVYPTIVLTPSSSYSSSHSSSSHSSSSHSSSSSSSPDSTSSYSTSSSESSSSESSSSSSYNSPPPPPPSLPNSTLTPFQLAILLAHNKDRAEANRGSPLSWSSSLQSHAESYAKSLCGIDDLKHSGTSGMGENLYWVSPGTIDAELGFNAAKAWYNEKGEYDPADPHGSHFTAMVWKATTKIGCGAYACDANTGGSGVYVVCNYQQPGNVKGGYRKNV